MTVRKLKFALSRWRGLYDDLRSLPAMVVTLNRRVEHLQEALGRIGSRQLNAPPRGTHRLEDHEFRVFSQFGEDGIIQFLLSHIAVEHKTFVEFGVGDYLEANTRFLLTNNNWSGLVIDSDGRGIERLRRGPLCWGYRLKAVHRHVTAENINETLEANGVAGEIGLLSIDIDGNDYWVWRAIDVISPAIAIVEYNYRFGREAAVTIPYDKDFRRGTAHPFVYFGASLKALCGLAARKGYAFVGCNRNGVNAFFVRRDKLPAEIPELSPEAGYVVGTFNEARDELRRFIPSSPELERRALMDLPLVDVGARDS